MTDLSRRARCNLARDSLAPVDMSLLPIIVETGGYRGTFQIRNVSPNSLPLGPFAAGDGWNSVRCFLPAGSYTIGVSHGVVFPFEVLPDGSVKSQRVRHEGSKLIFNSKPVVIRRGGYAGHLGVTNALPAPSAPETLTYDLWPGVVSELADAGYSLGIAPGNSLRINFADNGEVSLSKHYAGAGRCEGNVLTLNVVRVRVDPGTYAGPWRVVGVEKTSLPGARSLYLVPHVPGYALSVAPGRDFRFSLDASGRPEPAQVETAVGAFHIALEHPLYEGDRATGSTASM